MTTTSKTTYLIVGATRGIGRAVFDVLSKRNDVRLIVGVRDVDAPLAKELEAARSDVIVVEIDSAHDETPFAAAKHLAAQHGIDAIDVVLANAGIGGEDVPAIDTTPDTLRALLTVNSIAPLLLFKAFAPMLRRAASPRFLVTSSLIGTFGSQDETFKMLESASHEFTTYAVSKAAVNMIVKRIALEHDWLIAVPFHPGIVATDMAVNKIGADGVQQMVQQGIAMTAADSGRAIVKLIDEAQLHTHSGRFYDVQAGNFAAF